MDKEIKGFVKTIDSEIQNFKVADKKDRIIEGFFSTTDLDRGGEVSLTSAFEKTMPEYMKNPIVTFMHDFHKVMGKVLDYKIVPEKGVWVKAQLAKNVKWIDEEVWPLVEQGMIKSFSYGYATKDEEEGELDGQKANFLKEVELYEVAIVTLPMNSNAIFNVGSNGGVKSIKIEEHNISTPEDKTSGLNNKKEEDFDMEKIDEVVEGMKTLSTSINTLVKKFETLDEKAKEFSASISNDTVAKFKEFQEAEAKAKLEQEQKSDEEKEESEVLSGLSEINEAMETVVKLLTPKEEK
jgi:HK97 family phage prohead protease